MNDLVKQTKGALGMRATDENKNTRNLAADRANWRSSRRPSARRLPRR